MAYLDTSPYPVINSLPLIWDFAPRPAGLTIGIMADGVISLYDIFAQVVKPKKTMLLPINDMDILGRRRVGDSLIGDFPMPPKNSLAIPNLFRWAKYAYSTFPTKHAATAQKPSSTWENRASESQTNSGFVTTQTTTHYIDL